MNVKNVKYIKHLKLRIEVDVLVARDGTFVTSLINDALTELVNRVDFKSGTIKTGRASTHSVDFDQSVVTVDLFRDSINLIEGDQ